MAWFVSRRNCPSFLTANTVAGPLDRPHRAGRAAGDHQDPPTTLLLPGRTHHPQGAAPHFASAPALALGKPVQSRLGSIARPSTPSLTAAVCPDPPSGHLTVPANSRQPSPRRALLAHHPPNYARHGHCGPPSSCLGAYFTPPSSPSIGTWPGLFALPCPSTLVSTPAHIASVDSGLAGGCVCWVTSR